MIFSLKGKVIYKGFDFLVLRVNQVGYQIFISFPWLKKVKLNDKLEIFTYLYQRQETQELYGFNNSEELEFFKKLLTVSGVGPKLVQGLLSVSDLTNLKKAINDGRTSLLTKVSGLGQKTAQC